MITIIISGIIASFQLENESNVTPKTLKKSLDAANGEDVLITINSPGGTVFHGLEMFSLIRNYPGKTETRVISLAASMGSILALAGNKKSIENTAMYFIHNAQGAGFGDYRELAKESAWLKDISSLLANLYEENTTLSKDKAQKLMDDESQFFGKDLESLGFETVDTGNDVDDAVARVKAKSKIDGIRNKITDEEFISDLEKVAASISDDKLKFTQPVSKQNNKGSDPATGAGKNKREVSNMTLEELKTQHPDLYNQIFQAGAKSERDRVAAHMQWIDSAPEAVAKAIADGEDFSNVQLSIYTKASMNKQDLNNRSDDNPEDVTPDDTDPDLNEEAIMKEVGANLGITEVN